MSTLGDSAPSLRNRASRPTRLNRVPWRLLTRPAGVSPTSPWGFPPPKRSGADPWPSILKTLGWALDAARASAGRSAGACWTQRGRLPIWAACPRTTAASESTRGHHGLSRTSPTGHKPLPISPREPSASGPHAPRQRRGSRGRPHPPQEERASRGRASPPPARHDGVASLLRVPAPATRPRRGCMAASARGRGIGRRARGGDDRASRRLQGLPHHPR